MPREPHPLAKELGVREVINGRSFSTKCGGSLLDDEVIDAMARQNVLIGRIWPVMPTYVRITVGTREEMGQFQAAFQKVMHGAVAFSLAPARPTRKRNPHGMFIPV